MFVISKQRNEMADRNPFLLPGAAVVVPAHVARKLLEHVRRYYWDARSYGIAVDPDVEAVIEAFVAVSANGRNEATEPDNVKPSIKRLSTSEAADELQVSDRHVRRLAEMGELPAQRIGGRWTFDSQDVQDAIGKEATG